MSARRMVDLTPACSVDPIEVIGLEDATEHTTDRRLCGEEAEMRVGPEATRILTYAGSLECSLPIDQVRAKLRGPE